MKNRNRIIVAILFAGAGIGLICLMILSRKPETVYKGRPISSWVNGLNNQQGVNVLIEASNGWKDPMVLPIIIKALDKKDDLVQKIWQRVWPKLPPWAKSHLPRPLVAADIHIRAAFYIIEMRDYYKPAIPKLIRLVGSDEKWFAREYAIRALSACLTAEHPPDKDETAAAIRVLTIAMKDPNVRVQAAEALDQIAPGNAAARAAFGTLNDLR